MQSKNKNKKVLLGLSGGVDSAAAAALLKENGFEVTGYYFDTGYGSTDGRKDAEKNAEQLKIPLVYENVSELFYHTVIRDFCMQYSLGKTPNPCVICNPGVKFRRLFDMANQMGIESIATGHYARIFYDEKDHRYYVQKGVNQKKDQSYMLYRLPQSILERLLFPLGEIADKEKVREIVREEKLLNAEKKDSQEICFTENQDYAAFIETCGVHKEPGDFVDRNGNILGRHKGITHYTVGQRKGLGIALGKPAFVVEINAEKNQVVLGENEDLFRYQITSVDNFFTAFAPCHYDRASVKAKIRYSTIETEAILHVSDQEDFVTAEFSQPQRAATPGQSIVFYQNDLVIGGGFII